MPRGTALLLAVVLLSSAPVFMSGTASASHRRLVDIDSGELVNALGAAWKVDLRAFGTATSLSGNAEIAEGTLHHKSTDLAGTMGAGGGEGLTWFSCAGDDTFVKFLGTYTASSAPEAVGLPIAIVACVNEGRVGFCVTGPGEPPDASPSICEERLATGPGVTEVMVIPGP